MIQDPKVSVVVVNHNRADLLSRCISSLQNQTFNPFEILVVDNASTDESRFMVGAIADPRILWLPQPNNRGFAAANNIGIRAARSSLIALLNNDAEASGDWLEQLVRAASRDNSYGMWASRILATDGQSIDKVGHLMFLDGQNRGRGTGQYSRGRFEKEEECFFPDGCAALYRLEMLKELGGFDEHFFAYADDADLGVRACWRGWKCLYVPHAIVYHQHSSTLGAYSPEKIYWIERNRLWLAVKSLPLPLLLLSPIFTIYRWSWNFAAAVLGRGAAGHFTRKTPLWKVLKTLVRAIIDAMLGVPMMWRKRQLVFSSRRISHSQFLRKLWLYRISARELAFQDKE